MGDAVMHCILLLCAFIWRIILQRTEKKKLEKAKKARDGSAVKVARAEKSASCARCFEPAEKDRFVCINNEYYHDYCFPDVLS